VRVRHQAISWQTTTEAQILPGAFQTRAMLWFAKLLPIFTAPESRQLHLRVQRHHEYQKEPVAVGVDTCAQPVANYDTRQPITVKGLETAVCRGVRVTGS